MIIKRHFHPRNKSLLSRSQDFVILSPEIWEIFHFEIMYFKFVQRFLLSRRHRQRRYTNLPPLNSRSRDLSNIAYGQKFSTLYSLRLPDDEI